MMDAHKTHKRASVLKLFELPTENIAARLQRPPGRTELFAIAVIGAIWLGFGLLSLQGVGIAYDWSIFYNTAVRDYTGFYYGPWILPLYHLLALLPFAPSYIAWNLINLVMLWLAARMFGGNMAVMLLSYQSIYCLFYGQIVGLVAGALALMYWALLRERYILAGLLFALASVKPQIGFVMGVTFILLANTSWFNRIKVVFVSSLPVLASVIWYPDFIADVYYGRTSPPNDLGSISLWQYIGAWALVLWLPTLLLRLSPGKRVIAVLITTALTLPYFQQTDLLLLYALPTGLLGLLGNIGYLMIFLGWRALPLVVIVPLVGYVWVFVVHFWERRQSTD